VKASAVRYLVDAGPLVGAFSPRDRWHEWSRETLRVLGAETYTTETVFAEAGHLLKQYPKGLVQLLQSLHEGTVRFLPVYPQQAPRCMELVLKYPERMDVGDASLVILSEAYPAAKLVTLDLADFSIYRRRDGRPVPLIAPGQSHGYAVEEAGAPYAVEPSGKTRRAPAGPKPRRPRTVRN
jgi:predicted nucleic acid-binding protein